MKTLIGLALQEDLLCDLQSIASVLCEMLVNHNALSQAIRTDTSEISTLCGKVTKITRGVDDLRYSENGRLQWLYLLAFMCRLLKDC